MSYLDQLSTFSDSLNTQHEQMGASLTNLSQTLQQQFDDEYNKVLEQMEIAGGAISVSGMGLSGIHKTMKGFKNWKDARTARLAEADEIRNRPPPDRIENLQEGGEGMDTFGRPEGEDPASAARPQTGKLDLVDEGLDGEVDDKLRGQNALQDENTFQTEPVEGGGEVKLNPLADKSTQQGVWKKGQGSSFADDARNPPDLRYDPLKELEAKQAKGSYKPTLDSIPEGNSADATIGGTSKSAAYDFEPDGLFDEPHHTGSVRGKTVDIGRKATGKADVLGDTDFKPSSVGEPRNLRETRTTYQIQPPDNTRGRSGTRSGDIVGEDGDNPRVGGSKNPQATEVETSFDRPNPKFREPVLGEGNKINKGVFTDSTRQQEGNYLGDADGREPPLRKFADQDSKLGTSKLTDIGDEDDITREPFADDTGSLTRTPNTKSAGGDYLSGVERPSNLGDTNIMGGKGGMGGVSTSGDITRTPIGQANIEKSVGLPEGSAAEGSGGYSTAERAGLTNPQNEVLDTGGGEGVNVGVMETGEGVGAAERTGIDAGLEQGGRMLGGEAVLADGGEALARAGIMGAVEEMGAMGIASAGLGALAPVADVVGAGFMIAGLVKDLTQDPEKVADTIAGGVSGKLGFDASALGGDEKGGLGIL